MLRRAFAPAFGAAIVCALAPAAGTSAAAGSSCLLWSDPAGDAAPAQPSLDLSAVSAGLGTAGPRILLTVSGLPAAGASLVPSGTAAISWELRWSYAGTLYYAAARATAAQPASPAFDVGTVQQGQEVPIAAATGTLAAGMPGTIAIEVPAAAVGAPAAGAVLADPTAQVRVVESSGATVLADQGGPGAAYRLGAACAPAAAAGSAGTQAAASHGGSSAGPSGQAPDASGLVTLGELDMPPAARQAGVVPFPIAGDRAYYLYTPGTGNTRILEYDISQPVPRLLADADTGQNLGSFNYGKDMRAIDDRDGVGLFLNWGPLGTQIIPINLSTLQAGPAWDLSTGAPGFVADGITYSDVDHRAYLVGEVVGNQSFSTSALPDYHAAVVSFDPATQTVDWIRVVTGCDKVLNTFGSGSVIARSENQPALYFACWQGGFGGGSSGQFAGSASIVRLWIHHGATQSDALGFQEDVFPISGTYLTGVISGTSAFDYGSDRFFLLSQSQTTPGAWVLDGLSSSWAGFVSSPNPCDDYIAVDSATGALIVGADSSLASFTDNSTPCPDRPDGWTLVSDGRQLPPSEGLLANGRYASGQMVVDPHTNRFFIPQDHVAKQFGGTRDVHVAVVEDVAAPPPPPAPLDYDALTSDVAESASTTSDFAGDAQGFGARALLVGGAGAAFANLTCGDLGQCGVSGIENGDRGLYWARAGGLDLRPIGASSGGESLQPDELTANDLVTQSGGALSWPWSPVACLDAGGGKQSPSASGPGSAAASATCDLAGRTVGFSGSASAVDTGVGLTIGHESVSSRVWVDPAAGTLTDTVAEARGIDLVGTSGEVRIGRVFSEARTAAHGRHGTASATLTQLVEQVTVLDASGNVLLSCATVGGPGCDPAAVAAAANSALEGVMQITFPKGSTSATPHGAFAAVRKSDVEYYNDEAVNDDTSYEVPALQVVIFNDGQERSRLLVQMAGVEGSSIYEVHAPQPLVSQTLPEPLAVLGPLSPAPAPPAVTTASRHLLVRTIHHLTEELGILFRSPLQAFGFLLLMGLFGLAAFVAWRRRELARLIKQGAVL